MGGNTNGPVVKPTNGKLQLHCKGKPNGSGIEWSLDDRGGPPSGKIVKVDLPRDSGPCELTIHLTVAGGADVAFNTEDPIWAAQNACPRQPGIHTDQIEVVPPTEAKKLTFVSKNQGDPQSLFYQLNFVGADPLDPEIKSGGGSNMA